MPGRADSRPQTTNAERSCRALCSTTRSLRSLRSEIAMHRVAATDRYPSPTRRGATAHATAGHAGGNAAATINRGTSIRQFEIPHLRTSTLPAARIARSTNRNQPCGSRLQSEAHGEHSRRTQATCTPAGHLISLHQSSHGDDANSPPQNKKRCSGTRNIALTALSLSFRNNLLWSKVLSVRLEPLQKGTPFYD